MRLPSYIHEYHPRRAPPKGTALYSGYLSPCAHCGERQQHRTSAEPFHTGGLSRWAEGGCGPEEASCPDTTVCRRHSSRKRDHDRFVLRPFSSHPCCICAASFGGRAGRASHGNACHASHRSKFCTSHKVCCPGIARRASIPGFSSASPLGSSSSTSSSTKPSGSSRDSPPERSSATPPLPLLSPPFARGGQVSHVINISRCTLITPPAVITRNSTLA